MKENKNVPQPLEDEALDEATGGLFLGVVPKAVTLENPIVMKTQLVETICTRCGKIRSVPMGTSKCSCGGMLEKNTKSTSAFTVTL